MEFKDIYKEYAPKIFRFCLGYINDRDKAQDLTQETFIAVWQHLKEFRGESAIGTWIFKIASNKCLRLIDNEKRQQAILKNIPMDQSFNMDESNGEDALVQLRNSIAKLSETDRLIIGLYLEDIPQEKIAEIMGMSHANIRVKIHRIKNLLTEQLNQHG